MTFGEAIIAMEAGKCVSRFGWNGKNMHVYLEDGHTEHIGDGVFKGQTRTYEPVITLFNARGHHQPGWVCSQEDMLAKDWGLVSGN